MSSRIRTRTELNRLESFRARYNYLKLGGSVGIQTFGFDRYLNQRFYRSREWRSARDEVIARDLGCDLGVEGYEIFDRVYVHHMNPISAEDVEQGLDELINPEYLVTTTHQTHNAIHYGDENLLPKPLIQRQPGDTKLWG